MPYRLVTSAAAALLLTGAVAHAQSSSTGSSGASNPASSGAAATQQQAGGNQGSADRMRAMSQDKLRQVLSQAGFQDIRIVDAAYLIQARTKDGESVTMFLNPPSSVDTTASTSASPSSGSAGTSTSPNTATPNKQ